MEKTINGIKEVIFILDKSGSMEPLTQSTIDGFNEMLGEQKQLSGRCLVTTVLFNKNVETVYSRKPVNQVVPLSRYNYITGGTTALLDAIGSTVTSVRQMQMSESSDERPEKTLMVITTDGMENASREYSLDSIRGMLSWLQEEENWEVVYMGAALNSDKYAKALGISSRDFVAWEPTVAGNRRRNDWTTKKLKDFLN